MAGAECPELARSALMGGRFTGGRFTGGQRTEPGQGPVLGHPDRAR